MNLNWKCSTADVVVPGNPARPVVEGVAKVRVQRALFFVGTWPLMTCRVGCQWNRQKKEVLNNKVVRQVVTERSTEYSERLAIVWSIVVLNRHPVGVKDAIIQ